jgi:hypothetical protein
MSGELPLWAQILIPAGSLLVSIIALLNSNRAQRKAIDAQSRIVEIEEQREKEKKLEAVRARVRPQLRAVGNSYRLYLVNEGAAEARNVQVRLDGRPLSEHPAAIKGSSLPSYIGPGAEVSCLLAISQSCHPPFEIQIHWEDDSGIDGTYRTMLTL